MAFNLKLNSLNNKKIKAQRQGQFAETIASWFLRMKGYKLLSRNYKTKVGEIDLIVIKGNSLCFVEVKKRGSKEAAAFAISQRQKERIIRASELYVKQNPGYQQCDIRFDAILIGATVIPYHITNAWQPL